MTAPLAQTSSSLSQAPACADTTAAKTPSNLTTAANATATDLRQQAQSLYWQGWRVKQIAAHLGVKATTIHSWKRRDLWGSASSLDRIEGVTETRLALLIAKTKKEGCDYKEIDALGRVLERNARVKKYLQGGNEVDINPLITQRNNKKRRPQEKNAMTEEQHELLKKAFLSSLFPYQKKWHQKGNERIRNILKSRQIGATWYFAREAFVDALDTGRNQIFLSASKAQAQVFRQYILQFVKEKIDVELRGDPIVLPNGATLYFLGTNARTAQSYHGNLYLDEYFWIPRFQALRKVASGMSAHKQWRQTYFSTPSSLQHDAYPFWSGTLFNKGRPKDKHITLDVSHAKLASGQVCGDGQWRQIVTLEDAIADGCDLFDIEQISQEYSSADFDNLFRCQFIDDSASVFSFALMQGCMVDSLEVWLDFKQFAVRPFGDRPVWLGYDPALTGDNAGLIVLAPPAVPGGKFRVLEKMRFKGLDFAAQAEAIRKITVRYYVTFIGIDTSGLGQAVYQLVKVFYPAAIGFTYSIDVKARLVYKAYDVISKGRLEFDASHTDLAQSFMAIKQTTTESGKYITFKAGRSEEISHADLAWATMHALSKEPLEGSTSTNKGFMEFSE